MATRPPEHESIRTGRTPWPARLARLLRARNGVCLLVVLVASYASLVVYFRMDTPDGHATSSRVARWCDATLGPRLATVPFRSGDGIAPGSGIVTVVGHDPAYGWSDALIDPLIGYRRSLVPPFAFLLLAGLHLFAVGLYRSAYGFLHPWRSPFRYRRDAHSGSGWVHAATSAVLAVPVLASFQFLRGFWSAASTTDVLFYHNIYGQDRVWLAIAGLLASALCLYLLAIVVGGWLAARVRPPTADARARCDWCGYPVGAATCPECGRPGTQPSTQQWRVPLMLSALFAAAALLFAFTPLLMSWWSLIV